jgi:hypothetical protein
MTNAELIKALNRISTWQKNGTREPRTDLEDDHIKADGLLLEYIGDPAVVAAFDAINKWYA